MIVMSLKLISVLNDQVVTVKLGDNVLFTGSVVNLCKQFGVKVERARQKSLVAKAPLTDSASMVINSEFKVWVIVNNIIISVAGVDLISLLTSIIRCARLLLFNQVVSVCFERVVTESFVEPFVFDRASLFVHHNDREFVNLGKNI